MSTATGSPIALQLSRMVGSVAARQSRAAVARGARALGGRAPARRHHTDFDPLDPEVIADPYPWYRALHDSGPVHYCAKRAAWVVSGYDAVRAATHAYDRLSSADSVTRLRSAVPMMLTMDRPEHTRLRRLVVRDFTREAMERRRPDVRRLAADAIATMLAAERSDVVRTLAAPLPVAVIADILGVPAEDRDDFREWSDRLVEGFALAPGAGSIRSSATILGAAVKLHGYFVRHFERLRASPGDDVLSRLVASSREEALTEDELFWFAVMLLVAGNETTTNLLGTMLLSLAEHPEQYARLRSEPELIPSAVEECLRFVSPIQGFYRTAHAEYEVGAATIPAGARVLLAFGAANRDPGHYSEPDRFLVERNPTDHLGFGSGIHFCLGAHLARLEAAEVLREVVDRVAAIELAGRPVWNENPTLRGLSRLDLRLTPA